MRYLSYVAVHVAAAIAVLLLLPPGLRAQSDGILDVSGEADSKSQSAARSALPFWSQAAGQSDVAVEGFYVSSTGQPLLNITGVDFTLKEYLPGIGVIDGAFEGSEGGGFHTGAMYLGLKQAPIFGWHWDFVGGDSQVTSNLLAYPVSNVSTPDVSTRGFRVAMKRKDRAFQVFYGGNSLLGGQRIPYRLSLPQNVIGATMRQDIGDSWKYGFRFLHLQTDSKVLTTDSTFFFPGHVFKSSDSLAFQSLYSASKNVKIFGEVNYTRETPFTPSPVRQKPVSFFVGATWETEKFNLAANYVSQTVSYLPLLGYFSGDRQGPFLEGHYHITRNIEVYGSGSIYGNNLETNSALPTFHSAGISGGGSFTLPWETTLSASISTIHLTTQNPSQAAFPSDNRQLSIGLNRPFRRHNFRFSYIEIKLDNNSEPQSEQFMEAEDSFTWRKIVLRGAVRYQNSQITQTRNTVFIRGAVQANLKWLSAYADFEKGDDLVSRSVFSTSAYSTTVIGVSVPLKGGWDLQAEGFRNNLNTTLNPENVFLFPTAGLGATQLPGFGQSSLYFRIGKTLRWGNKEFSSASGIDQFAAARVPLVGSVEGRVTETFLAGMLPSANVSVSLDLIRSAITDSSGFYSFKNVPEGAHVVGLDMDRLPTDFASGPDPSTHVAVEPRGLVRSDFTVVRLIRLVGKIAAPSDMALSGVVIRISGLDRYTTPDDDGNFALYNLKAGEYSITIDPDSIPEESVLTSPASLHVSVSASAERITPATIEFRLALKPPVEKPVRQILQQPIHIKSAPRSTSNSVPASGTDAPKKSASSDKTKSTSQ